MKITKSQISLLRNLYSSNKQEYKTAINTALQLYQDRKIERLATLKNVLDKLSRNKPKGLQELQELNKKETVIGRGKKQDMNLLYNAKLSGITSFPRNKNALKDTINTLEANKLKDFKFSQLQLSMNKKKMIQVVVNKPNMTKDDIQRIADKMSKDFSKDKANGAFSVALKYDKGWRSGYFNDLGDDAHLFDEDVYDKGHKHHVEKQTTFNQFVFYAYEKAGFAGGASSNKNDCLYQCLHSVLFNNLPFKDDTDLKRYLKLNADSKIDIALIPKIETKLKNIAINISGDYCYTSKVKSNKIINLKLLNEHYTNDINKKDVKVKHVSYKERKPIIYDKNTFMCYDGEKEFFLTKDYRNEIYKWKTKYLLVNKNNDDTFVNEYNQFIHDANILKKESNGIVNLYKTGNNKLTALELFDKYTKHIQSDHLRQVESEFISKASQGPLLFHEKYNGPAYKFDIKSLYPSIMKSVQLFPVKEGELKYITELDNKEYFDFGIYRCVISGSNKIFKINKNNYYTHIDLSCARALNLNIKLIIDDKPNFLYYSRDKLLSGNELFGQYVDTMFELKEKNLTRRTKQIINILWGALSEKNTKKKVIDTNKILNIDNDIKLVSIRPFDDNNINVEYSNNDTQYKFGFARLAPFLISKGRKIISDIIKPYYNIAMRCHTDGVIFSENPVDIKTGDKLGELVYEGYCDNVDVVNSMIVIGDFN